MLVERRSTSDGEVRGRAAHQAPEVDGECVLVDGGRPPAVGDFVRCEVDDTDGVDLVVAPAGGAPARRTP